MSKNLTSLEFILILILVAIVVLFFPGCKDNASFNTVEQARAQAIENAVYNARAFKTGGKYAGWHILKDGDSTITAKCPQGDGWASMVLESDDQKSRVDIKCSTVSAALGCLLKSNFVTKSYANQEGRCNKEIPYPLPKIAE